MVGQHPKTSRQALQDVTGCTIWSELLWKMMSIFVCKQMCAKTLNAFIQAETVLSCPHYPHWNISPLSLAFDPAFRSSINSLDIVGRHVECKLVQFKHIPWRFPLDHNIYPGSLLMWTFQPPSQLYVFTWFGHPFSKPITRTASVCQTDDGWPAADLGSWEILFPLKINNDIQKKSP